MTISTPCVSLCLLDPASGLCQGCGRTVQEIDRWSRMDEPARLAVMAALPERRDRDRRDRLATSHRPPSRRDRPARA